MCMRPWIRRLRFFYQSLPPEGDLATKLYTSDQEHVDIEIVYTSDQKSKPLTTNVLFFRTVFIYFASCPRQYFYLLPLAHDNI